jgi:hypothetical protein
MRLVQFAMAAVAALTLVAAPAIGRAQDTPQRMLDLARQVRAQAAQMKDSLPPEDVADLLRQADEIEQGVRDGAYSAPVAKEPITISKRIADAHQGRLDWLARETACVGYAWENHRTFVSNYGDPERDRLCRTAYAHFEEYFLVTRSGNGGARSDRALEAYDGAARAAVDYYERKSR